jgi:hypothetical protein
LVSTETYIYFASGVIPILAYFTIKVKKSIPSRFVLAVLILSVSIDLLNFYCHSKKENNLFLVNIYDYIAIFLELFFFLSITKFRKAFTFLTSIVLILCWTAHFIFNLNYGFHIYSTSLSFSISLIVCIYSVIVTVIVIREDTPKFNKYKHQFIAIFGFFIFEALCLIPVSTMNLDLNTADRKHLAALYNDIILIAGFCRNILFTLYFLAENRKRTYYNDFKTT